MDVPASMLALCRALAQPEFGPVVWAELTVICVDGSRRTLQSPVTLGSVAPAIATAERVAPPVPTGRTHSADFTTMYEPGRPEPYHFSPAQAEAVRILWHAQTAGTPDVSWREIAERIDSTLKRCRDLFRRDGVMHPAWGVLILQTARGIFRLAD